MQMWNPCFDPAQFNISLSFGRDTRNLDTVQLYTKYNCMYTKYKKNKTRHYLRFF